MNNGGSTVLYGSIGGGAGLFIIIGLVAFFIVKKMNRDKNENTGTVESIYGCVESR